MEQIRQWTFAVCAALTAGSAMRMILPKSSLQRVYSVVITLFFLCCVLAPISRGHTAPALPQWESNAEGNMQERANALAETVQKQTQAAVTMEMEKIVREILAEMGIKGAGIAINIITNGQNDWAVEGLRLLLAEEWRPQETAIANSLQRQLGVPAVILYGEEESADGWRYAEMDGNAGQNAGGSG